jgi:hypothetical protein
LCDGYELTLRRGRLGGNAGNIWTYSLLPLHLVRDGRACTTLGEMSAHAVCPRWPLSNTCAPIAPRRPTFTQSPRFFFEVSSPQIQ